MSFNAPEVPQLILIQPFRLPFLVIDFNGPAVAPNPGDPRHLPDQAIADEKNGRVGQVRLPMVDHQTLLPKVVDAMRVAVTVILLRLPLVGNLDRPEASGVALPHRFGVSTPDGSLPIAGANPGQSAVCSHKVPESPGDFSVAVARPPAGNLATCAGWSLSRLPCPPGGGFRPLAGPLPADPHLPAARAGRAGGVGLVIAGMEVDQVVSPDIGVGGGVVQLGNLFKLLP